MIISKDARFIFVRKKKEEEEIQIFKSFMGLIGGLVYISIYLYLFVGGFLVLRCYCSRLEKY